MSAKDVFSVAIRIVGLLFLYQGLSAIPAALMNFCPIFPHFNFRSLIPSLFLIGWPLVVAWYLIKGAPRLMKLAYGEEGNRHDRRPPAQGPSVQPPAAPPLSE